MSSCYDSHELWMAAVATGECTISLTEYHVNTLEKIERQEKAARSLRTANGPLKFGLAAVVSQRPIKNKGGQPPRRVAKKS